MAFARSVILEPAVQEFLDEETKAYPRLDHVYHALEWRIARQPEVGYLVPRSNPKRFLMKSSYRFPIPLVLTLMYRYTDEKVFVELAKIDTDTGE